MSPARTRPGAGSQPERSGVVDSPEPICVICGGPRSPRKRETCSDACRAALNRQQKADAERRQKHDVGALLEAALNRLREDP